MNRLLSFLIVFSTGVSAQTYVCSHDTNPDAGRFEILVSENQITKTNRHGDSNFYDVMFVSENFLTGVVPYSSHHFTPKQDVDWCNVRGSLASECFGIRGWSFDRVNLKFRYIEASLTVSDFVWSQKPRMVQWSCRPKR